MEKHPGKQLFIDDFFIESMTGLRRRFHKPEKITVDGPLHTVVSERAWEAGLEGGTGLPVSGPVVYDEGNGRFRMYYQGAEALLCAVESADGLNWQRPSLGLVEFGGSSDNNIVRRPPDSPPGPGSILWDPHETEDTHRWKMMYHGRHKGIWPAYYSADGYDWRAYPPGIHNEQPRLFGFGAPGTSFGGPLDPEAPYICYAQRGSSRRTRVLGRRDSRDFLNWSGLHTVIEQDLDDPLGTEFYAAGHDMANRTDGGLHIIVLDTFLTDIAEAYGIDRPDHYWGGEPGAPALPARVDGLVEPQLAVSRNTVSWRRYREPFIERGAPGSWDWGCIYAAGPLLHQGQLFFFYNGLNVTHNNRSPQLRFSPERWLGTGLARLRPDGYIGVEADSYAAGVLTTHRFRQEDGGRVTVNADAAAGQLRYEVLEDTGRPMPGFTAAQCRPIRCDSPDHRLSWQGGDRWPGVGPERRAPYPKLQRAEYYIKLRFYIAPGTKLYSVTLDPPEVAQWQSRVQGRVD